MKETLSLYKNPIIWGGHLLGFVIAIWFPEDGLTKYPLLKALTSTINSLIPIAGNYSSRSAFPQVTEMYFSLMLIITALWVPLQLKATSVFINADAWQKHIKTHPIRFLMLQWFFALFIIPFGIYFSLWLNPGYDFHLAPINSSRLALGMVGPVFAGVAFIALAYESI